MPGKTAQLLSPENYIRKKARNLPIYECLVNKDWKESGFANLIVARSHTTGNITACMYLVDLYCLGVKETHYVFNMPKAEYKERLVENSDDFYMPVSYELAHNIIFAAIEFAENFDFKPDKSFSSTTKFLLEEDTDEVELIEIECGKNGKPFFISSPDDDKAKIKRIVAQLEKTAGPGNYLFIDCEQEELAESNFQEKRKLFLDLYARNEDLDDDEFEQYVVLIDDILQKIIDPVEVDKISEEYLNDFDLELTNGNLTAEMLGLPGQTPEDKIEEFSKLFIELYSEVSENPDYAMELLEKFGKAAGEIPAVRFLELVILKDTSGEFQEKLADYLAQYPQYPFLRIMNFSHSIIAEETDFEQKLTDFTMRSIFAGRTEIHNIEAFNYISALLLGVYISGNFDRLQTLYEAYMNLEFSDLEFEMLDNLIFMMKANAINSLFSLEEN